MHKLIAALIAATFGAMLVPAPAGADEPTRVLIVGDSVTQGYQGDYTWRYFFNKSRPDLDLVGRRTGTFYAGGTDWDFDYNAADAYADPNFDQDHGATYGGRVGRDDNPWFHDPIGPNVTTYQPDTIFALWGFNDLHHKTDGPAEVIASYDAWITEAREAKPDINIVLGGLSQNWDPEVPAFNAALADLAALRDTDASRVIFAPAPAGYTTADTKDDVHPNTDGERKIAAQFVTAAETLMPAPAPPAPMPVVPEVPVTPVPPANLEQVQQVAAKAPVPARPTRVRAIAKTNRTVVTWARVAGATRYNVRCGTAKVTVTRSKASLRTEASRCKVRAINEAGASRWIVARVR